MSAADRARSLDDRIRDLPAEKRAIFEKLAAASDAIPRRAADSPAPLSFAQQRLWFIEQLMPGTALFNLSTAIRVDGDVDEEILERSVNEIVRRHDSLRTTFTASQGEPVQEVLPQVSIELRSVDLRPLPADERDAEARRLLALEGEQPFDLEKGPLLRTLLLRTGDSDCVFSVVMHHIVSDAWSLDLFWNELSTVWEQLDAGREPSLPSLPLQYADFAAWEYERLTGPALAELVSYWREQLADLPTLELSTDRPRPSIPSGCGAAHYIAIPAAVTSSLRSVARQEGATVFMVTLAAFQTLLGRWAGQDDVVVGTFTANRDRREIEGVVGFFVNALVLRADLSGEPTFRDLLKQVRRTALDAYSHQELPFARLIQELSPERDLSRNPLFQVAFQLLQAAEARADVEDDLVDLQRTTAALDLTCTVHDDGGDSLLVELEYSTDLFELETIEALGGNYATLLAAVAADPDRCVHDLPLVDRDLLERVVEDWNRIGVPYSGSESLISLFEDQVALTPDRIAIRCGAEAVTYRELNGRANGLARRLRSFGVGLEVPVGIHTSRSIELVVALLAVLKVGGVYVPLDARHPRERVDAIVADAGIDVVLDFDALADIGEDSANLRVPVSPDGLACVIYTSGSTGRAKGVAITHRQLLNRLQWMWDAYPFADGEVSCQKTPVGFVDSLWELLGPLLRGVPTVLVPDEVVSDPDGLVDVLATERVSRLLLVPPLLHALLEAYPDLGRRLPAVRLWVASGEELTRDLARLFGARVPGAVLVNVYGASEAWDATWYDPRRDVSQNGRVPIGRPIANMHAYVLDRRGRPVAPGMRGELHVGGAGLARGYLGSPRQTAARFVPNPFGRAPGSRLYRTGDLARYRSDGEIEFLGRADAQVKLRGFRIELGEIESVLARHPSVRQVVAALRDDDESEPRLVAYVVRDPDGRSPEDAFAAALRRFLRRSLPEYMIPAAFVVLPALPLTATGKIDRRNLPSPDGVLPLLARDYVAPRTPLEAELAAIWRKLLGVERVGVHDNFFELGGHSLLAIRVLARVQDTLKTEVSFRAIFDFPTVAGLAAVVEETRARRARGDDLPIIPLSRADHAAVFVLDDELALELAQTDPGSEERT